LWSVAFAEVRVRNLTQVTSSSHHSYTSKIHTGEILRRKTRKWN